MERSPSKFLLLALVVGCGGEEPGTLPGPNADSPVVAGFERFHRSGDPVAGGVLLLGELACLSCHLVPGNRQGIVYTKAAPALAGIGGRVHPDRIRGLIADPHGTKPGSTMPDLWAGVDPATRDTEVDALVHFLVSLSPVGFQLRATDEAAADRGEELFNAIGCAACHAPLDIAEASPVASIPLPDMANRYALDGLVEFLRDPLAVRPAGRMPSLHLSEDESYDLAHALSRGTNVPGALRYAVFNGRFEGVEDLSGMDPVATGVADAFDLGPAPRRNDYGLRFEGFVEVPRSGEYTFHLHAGYHARLWIDGKMLVDAEGGDEPGVAIGTADLEPGWHEIAVSHVQRRGSPELGLEWQGPGLSRQTIPRASLRYSREPIAVSPAFDVDEGKALLGRQFFDSRGCVACHGDVIYADAIQAWEMLRLDQGCLAADPRGVPDYRLDDGQRTALRLALGAMVDGSLEAPTAETRSAATMASWNCYACHERNGVGGVPEDREQLFIANKQDLGEEGRIPPNLDGVGDRLRGEWLSRVLTEGASVRPYMETRMPRFGAAEVASLAGEWIDLDRSSTPLPEVAEGDATREAGRLLVGEGRMNCILCHDFHRREAPTMGVHDLITTTERLNEDWFVRYLKNPELFHPGTRMPGFWPFNRSAATDILNGDADLQIRAIWDYLAQGEGAVDPEGLSRQNRELIVGGQAIVYRGKFWDAGWRGIAVGYPGGVNLCFDAEQVRLALLWKGQFLDVSRHWNVQGMGLLRPLGEYTRILPQGRPFAVLESGEAPWPTEAGWRTAPYRFRGYGLDDRQRPTFRYEFMGVQVDDQPEVRAGDGGTGVVRVLSFTAAEAISDVWFRIAAGEQIELIAPASYLIDDQLTVRIESSGSEPVVVSGREHALELRVPLNILVGTTDMSVEYVW